VSNIFLDNRVQTLIRIAAIAYQVGILPFSAIDSDIDTLVGLPSVQ
jgi:hypothetical protein